MRHWLPIVCVIALLLYIGWVLDDQPRQAGTAPAARIGALDRAMTRAGGSLETATFILAAPISDPALPGEVRERLGWTGPAPRGERREARLHTEQGMYYLALNWQMTGDRAAKWAENHAALTRALAGLGVNTPVHVQLEGKAKGKDLLALAHTALDGVAAGQRQPWSAEKSASVAGRSAQLPAGPHPVNVQAAVRQTVQGIKLWVAWPALTGDY